MNIENLASYLKNKEPFSERSISEIMHVIEKHPYFQIAHMLLLKGIQQVQPDNYNKQLKISGSFVSDKSKLFQFINSEIPAIKEIKTANITNEKESVEKPTEKKHEENERPLRIKEKKEGQITSISKTIPTKVESEVKKETHEKPVINKERTKEPVKKETTVRKKVDLPEDEIEKIADENSKNRHHEIIKDFFHSSEKPATETKTIIQKREEPIKATTKEIKKEAPQEKQVIKEFQKKEPVIKEIPIKKESVIKQPEKEEKEVIAKRTIKGTNITEKERPIKTETTTPIKKQVEELEKKTAKDLISKKEETTTPPKKESNEADAMNNIFSKIRQIKKEMNIDSGTTPKTIDVNVEDDGPKLKKTTTTKSSSGRVIKESFIGFDETPSNLEKKETVDKKEDSKKTEIKEETEQIKDSGLTAKDLFKKHKLQKEKSIFSESEQSDKKKTTESTVSPISKLVDIVNDKTIKTEPEKSQVVKEEKKESTVVTGKTFAEDEEKLIDDKVAKGEISAAEALLQRIAAKKRRIQKERLEEEHKKEEEKRKELEAVDKLVKQESKKPLEKTTESKTIEKVEEKTEPEEKKRENNEIKEEAPVKKSRNLIDSFIEKADSLERIGSKEPKLTGDISIESTVESEDIMTETYADLLIQQKNYKKAIEVYNKLILKFPEKKTYFAIQIKKVESLIK